MKFIRYHGRVIPIKERPGRLDAAGTSAASLAVGAGAVTGFSKLAQGAAGSHALRNHKTDVKVNRALDMTALGLSVASGVIGAATFSHGTKGFLLGAAATHAIDAVGIGVNVASVAGKGNAVGRAKQGAKQEARNLLVGNAVYAAGLVGSAKNRAAIAEGAKITAKYGAKVLNVARKALRVASEI